MPKLGSTGIDVFPLCLGGNVFGWTADRDASFEILDAYVAAGGNFIDTADSYTAVPPNVGGESETIIGEWMQARGNRDEVVLATKVGMFADRRGLAAENIRAAAEDSLRRLRTDRIDLYYAHADDETVPLAETLGAFDALVREGKVRHIAASQFSAARLKESFAVSDREGFARYVALQPEYNLVARDRYERELRGVVDRERLACLPYFGLAGGFLTGKYRPGVKVDSVRAQHAGSHLDGRGLRILDELDAIAQDHQVGPGAIALAWLAAQPSICAPIASARTAGQLAEILPMAEVSLSETELARLAAVSA